MTLAGYLLGLALIAAASFFVAAPLFRPRAVAPRASGGEREREDRAPHSAGTCARPSSYATARRSAADGHIVTSVPPAMMTPPIQSHDTSGFT